jgi:polyhydroxyalkanoate synthase
MENKGIENLQELAENITKASQKIIQNYLENKSGYEHDNIDIADAYTDLTTKLLIEPDQLSKVHPLFQKFINDQQELWKRIAERQLNVTKEYKPVITPAANDKRFRAPEWDEAPYYFDFVKQSYLLVSQLMTEIIDVVDMDYDTKKKLNFFTKQYIDALSPSNFVITNPEAIKLAQQTNGQSLMDGYKNLLQDIQRGKISQTDESKFEVGVNLAITEGAVIFENELMQLIQYSPSTKTIYEIPLLMVPALINKFYLLDLRPENSLAKFSVDQGFITFMISWKNSTADMGITTFDDYIEKGTLKAIEVIQAITKAKKINVLGNCLGGTIVSVTLAILAKRKSKEENPVNTATFLASMIDFSDVGPMGGVIDNALVKKLERGELSQMGVMRGRDMETAFNLIRANDLIWSCVVNNYLKGKPAPVFDVLFWTNDNTNLPANAYLYYLRNMILENKLSRKNALRICNTQIDIGKIEMPVYVIGMRDDHICPAHTAFTTTELVSGSVEFILGGSGHVIGVTNAPTTKKYGYYLDGELDNGFEIWQKTAKFHDGSWWTPWSERLSKKSGKKIAPYKTLGNTKFKVIEPAPGRYVKEKSIMYLPNENTSVPKK